MKFPVKMVVTDLDGTLFTTDKKVTLRTKTALADCRAAGIKTVYATGRGDSSANMVPREFFDGRVLNNGAVAYAGPEIVYACLVPCLTARPLLLALNERGLRTGSQRKGMHYTNFDVAALWPHITDFAVVDFAVHEKDAEKIYVESCTPDDAAFIEENLPDELYLTVARDGLGQIMHKNATKSMAVQALARFWHIDQKNIAAFGDDMNDMDLLLYAGCGVAMANALDEAKAAAGYICRTNDDDGVARWIEEYIL